MPVSLLLTNVSAVSILLFGLGMSYAAQSEQTGDPLAPVCSKTAPREIRRRPGETPILQYHDPACDSDKLMTPRTNDLIDLTPVPDRWRIVETLGYPVNWQDPYHGMNPLKGDRPVFGQDWFINFNASSSSTLDYRRIPLAREASGVNHGNTLLRSGNQLFFNQNFSFDAIVYKGDTVFRPPDYQFRFTPVSNYNRTDYHGSADNSAFAVQALFVEKYLRDASDHYDFDSIRIGIQPFTSDFRGFLLLDQQLGIRLFGTRDNNIFQYNIAWLRRFKKRNRLNDPGAGLANNDVLIANLYWQDLLVSGFTSQVTLAYNRNREQGTRIIADELSTRTPARFQNNVQHDYDVVYLGYNGDGHIGRVNLTGSFYYVIGTESDGTFVDSETDVNALFAASEISVDFDWIRLKFSALHASGDDDPFDNNARGFDGIFQQPVFAGTVFSFFNRQRLPLAGNRISLKRKNALFNSLRSLDDPGQSNFTNPGLNLIGVGADFDVLPELRISLQANQLWFDETESLEAVFGKQNIASNIGQDFSVAAIYRPFATQNLIISLSAAMLVPGQGYRDIYDGRLAYSMFSSFILNY